MAQVKLVLVAAALLALLVVAMAAPAKHLHDEDHAVSESSSSSSESGSSSSEEQSNRKRQPERQPEPARAVPQEQQDEQDEQYDGLPMGNAIPVEPKSSGAFPPYPKPVRSYRGRDVVEQKMEPGQPWESHYKHGVAPAKLPAQETDNAHSYRHSIIHPYGDDLHA